MASPYSWEKSADVPKGSEWEKKIDGMAEDIRTLGKNSKDITELHKKYHNPREISGLQGEINTIDYQIDYNQTIIKKNIKEADDYNGEAKNIIGRCDDLGLRDELNE